MARRIKNLFVSYSRDDKHWTYEFAKALRESLTLSAFVDYRSIHIGTDWWRVICENIEACDCVVYVMTPKSIESLYCREEIAYALALNKPILPIMLKTCPFPEALSRKRVQYLLLTDDMQLQNVLLQLQQGLLEIQGLMYEGEYNAPTPAPPRPDEPRPQDSKSAEEVFDLAAEAAEAGQLEQAENLFVQVERADGGGRLGKRAQKRLAELRSYRQVARRAEKPATLRDAREMWQEHCEQFGSDFDPLNLAETLIKPPDPPANPPPAQPPASSLPGQASARIFQDTPPFAWIDIPGEKGKTWTGAPYKIAKYPVTNAQFGLFVQAGGYSERRWWTDAGWKQRQNDGWTQPRYWTDSKWNGAEQPVVGVSWYEAVAFCLWLSEVSGERIMLPTEDQWQYAAQGDDGRDYPWGPKWDASRCNNNVDRKGIGRTTPVQQYEGRGDSFFGVVDMAGNVWEWCLTDYDIQTNDFNSSANSCVLRGGSWYGDYTYVFRCGYRVGSYPHYGNFDGGFRLSLY